MILGAHRIHFNRQVKNNAERFEGDEFMFRLTKEEYGEILRRKNFTSSWGGSRYLPFAFTEQGLYLLMTVLRGDLAVKQSRALVMAFKAMKDYIADTRGLVTQRDLLRLSMQTTENTEAIRSTHTMLENQQKILLEHDDKLVDAFEKISETVKRSDLSPVMLKFDIPEDNFKKGVKRDRKRSYFLPIWVSW